MLEKEVGNNRRIEDNLKTKALIANYEFCRQKLAGVQAV